MSMTSDAALNGPRCTAPLPWRGPSLPPGGFLQRCVSALSGALLIVLALMAGACSKNTTTSPSSATTTASTPTVRERFTSTLPVGGSVFFSFSIATAGTVVATLESIGGAGVPPSVIVNLGLGAPYQTTCSASPAQVQVTGDAGLSAVVTSSPQPGAQCVVVSDVGNLFAPATFTVVIDHP
jgi:hypothetical protein